MPARPEVVETEMDGAGDDAHENPFNRLMQSNPVATMLLRWDDLTIIDVNPALVALVGFPAEALLGRELAEHGIHEFMNIKSVYVA